MSTKHRHYRFLDAFNKSRGTFLRTIPVQKSLDATRNVAAFAMP